MPRRWAVLVPENPDHRNRSHPAFACLGRLPYQVRCSPALHRVHRRDFVLVIHPAPVHRVHLNRAQRIRQILAVRVNLLHIPEGYLNHHHAFLDQILWMGEGHLIRLRIRVSNWGLHHLAAAADFGHSLSFHFLAVVRPRFHPPVGELH